MLFIGTFAALVHSVCMVLFLLLFGRITGTFTIQSFTNHCHEIQTNETILIIAKKCPLGIDLNLFNFDRLNKLIIDIYSFFLSFAVQI